MSVTYGFFNAQMVDGTPDRAYNAYQMSSLFKGIIKDGVFELIGNHLRVLPTSPASLAIRVDTGKCWFDNHWMENDSLYPMNLTTAHVLLNRIDSVCVCVNDEDSVRTVSLTIVNGTPASSPVAPTLPNTSTVHYHRLANVYVAANATSITQSNITNRIGTSECPYITGPLQTVSADTFLAQWNSQFNDFMTNNGSSFNTWFTNLQNELDSNQAANLQNQINKITRLVGVTISASNWTTHTYNGQTYYTQTITQDVNGLALPFGENETPMLFKRNAPNSSGVIDPAQVAAYNTAFGKLANGVSRIGNGSITFYVTEKTPTSGTFNVNIKGV